MRVKALYSIIIDLLISFSAGIRNGQAQEKIIVYEPEGYYMPSHIVRYHLRAEKRSPLARIGRALRNTFGGLEAPGAGLFTLGTHAPVLPPNVVGNTVIPPITGP